MSSLFSLSAFIRRVLLLARSPTRLHLRLGMPLFLFFLLLYPFDVKAKLYKYVDKDGGISFTNNIELIPLSLRNQVEVLSETATSSLGNQSEKGEETATSPSLEPSEGGQDQGQSTRPSKERFPLSISLEGLKTPLVKYSLIIIIVILLLLCLKLWIENIIIKFFSKIAIRIALIALLYVISYYLFISPENSPLSETAKKAAKSFKEIPPLKKAQENIEQFNKSQKAYKKALDDLD